MIDVDRLPAEVGATVEFNDVLLVGGNGNVSVGRPLVEGARVIAEVVEHGRDKKILVFKYKAKTRYRRRRGHRQDYTRLAVRQIVTAEGVMEAAEKPKRRRAAGKTEEQTARRTRARKAAPEVAAEAPAEAAEPAVEAAVETPEAKPARRTRARKAEPESAEATAEAAIEAPARKPARRTLARKAEPEASAEASVEAEEKPKRTRRKKTESE